MIPKRREGDEEIRREESDYEVLEWRRSKETFTSIPLNEKEEKAEERRS